MIRKPTYPTHKRMVFNLCVCCTAMIVAQRSAPASDRVIAVPDNVRAAETRRIELIARVAPSVVCVYNRNQSGGGSGVLIDPEGYGLTNYHVVAGLLNTRNGFGGLADGVLYDLEVLGIDVTGDVAMFRLVPPKPGFRFPFAKLGDSDRVRVGDTAIAIGNPFSLSENYTPSVSLGMVTGVHRYQWGVKGNLAYTDCIQVDAPINPGNSGGPLFNAAGEVVGINGRISVNTRGRFNVGFGYAITSSQIKRFMPALRAGILARHGTWQAVAEDRVSSGLAAFRSGGVRFAEVKSDGPAYDAGIRADDNLVSIDGTAIETANQVASLLGTYPADWPVLVGVERHGVYREEVVRLEPVDPKMRRAFELDRNVNMRAVMRVLRSFRRAVLRDGSIKRPARWRWTADRTYHPREDGTVRQAERFEVSQNAGAMGRMRQLHLDGSSGRLIEFDDNEALQQVTTDEPAYALPPGEAMVYSAMFVLYHKLLEPVAEQDLTYAVHVGADALIDIDPSRATKVKERSVHQRIAPRLLEVIHWFMPSGAGVKFLFDAETFLLVRMIVMDDLSGSQVTIDLSDYRDVGGIFWPTAMEVKRAAHGYCETMSDWKVSR